MSTLSRVQVRRVIDEADRRDTITVLRATYQREKQWVSDPETQVPQADLGREDIAWFIATIRGRPAGVLRVHFAPPLAQYAQYGLKLMDPRIDVDDFIRRHRVAEIGRFAVLQRYRRQFLLAAALMRAATVETVSRGFTHFVTDVFEDDPHSPYGFHTRVIRYLTGDWPDTLHRRLAV
jgi:hypothetical protein